MKKNIILIVIFFVLALTLLLVRYQQANNDRKTLRTSLYIDSIADISKFQVQTPDAEYVISRVDDTSWSLDDAPVKQDFVDAAMQALQESVVVRVAATSMTDVERYGLGSEAARLTVFDGDDSREFLLGSKAQSADSQYVYSPLLESIVVVDRNLSAFFVRGHDTWLQAPAQDEAVEE